MRSQPIPGLAGSLAAVRALGKWVPVGVERSHFPGCSTSCAGFVGSLESSFSVVVKGAWSKQVKAHRSCCPRYKCYFARCQSWHPWGRHGWDRVVWVSLQILGLKLDGRLPATGCRVATLKHFCCCLVWLCVHQVAPEAVPASPDGQLPGVWSTV